MISKLKNILSYLANIRDGLIVTGGTIYVLGYSVWAFFSYQHNLGLLPVIRAQYLVAGMFPFFVIIAIVG